MGGGNYQYEHLEVEREQFASLTMLMGHESVMVMRSVLTSVKKLQEGKAMPGTHRKGKGAISKIWTCRLVLWRRRLVTGSLKRRLTRIRTNDEGTKQLSLEWHSVRFSLWLAMGSLGSGVNGKLDSEQVITESTSSV